MTLVTHDWLLNNRHLANLVILDATVYLDPAPEGQYRGEFRSGLESYISSGHIPAARFADLFTEFSDPEGALPFTLPSREQFEAAAGRLGITPDSHVVIYDDVKNQWAARLWWVFLIYGHPQVSVLDGGLKYYLARGGELEKGLAPYNRSAYRTVGPTLGHATTSLVEEIASGQREGRLVCLLQKNDFDGKVPVRERNGHIPGSVNLPFDSLVNESDNRLLPKAALLEKFRTIVPLDGELLVTYCGGGIASTLGALALAVAGYSNTLEYDGSLAAWIQNPLRPLEPV